MQLTDMSYYYYANEAEGELNQRIVELILARFPPGSERHRARHVTQPAPSFTAEAEQTMELALYTQQGFQVNYRSPKSGVLEGFEARVIGTPAPIGWAVGSSLAFALSVAFVRYAEAVWGWQANETKGHDPKSQLGKTFMYMGTLTTGENHE